jgi:3-isopropylmalate/(R)-2-methylmalate dehydratase small subunit
MEPFAIVTGVAAPLPGANIDTDVIMPKQFLKGIDREGLARGAFYDLRFDAAGQPRPDFILNRPEYRHVRFLVVGPNFGCGSSREHAVWGLKQLGIRALIGTSFASIFYDNCLRNGVLPISLMAEQVADLQALCACPALNRLTVDLVDQVIFDADGHRIRFGIDELRRNDLIKGLDPVASTLQYADDIRAFERAHFAANPWLADRSHKGTKTRTTT